MNRNPRPALLKKLTNAEARAAPLMEYLAEYAGKPFTQIDIYWLAQLMTKQGFTAPRGGPVTYNTVMRALERLKARQPPA